MASFGKEGRGELLHRLIIRPVLCQNIPDRNEILILALAVFFLQSVSDIFFLTGQHVSFYDVDRFFVHCLEFEIIRFRSINLRETHHARLVQPAAG
jgi:hypothetical protein